MNRYSRVQENFIWVTGLGPLAVVHWSVAQTITATGVYWLIHFPPVRMSCSLWVTINFHVCYCVVWTLFSFTYLSICVSVVPPLYIICFNIWWGSSPPSLVFFFFKQNFSDSSKLFLVLCRYKQCCWMMFLYVCKYISILHFQENWGLG